LFFDKEEAFCEATIEATGSTTDGQVNDLQPSISWTNAHAGQVFFPVSLKLRGSAC